MTSRDPVEVQMLPQHAAFLASPQTFLHNVVAMCTLAVSPAGRQLQPGVRRQKVKIQSEDEYVERKEKTKSSLAIIFCWAIVIKSLLQLNSQHSKLSFSELFLLICL